jgi:hypothetical protein
MAEMQLRLERQSNPVADEVSAITAVARPILIGTLYALQRARVERFGDYADVRLTDLAREYRAGDGDCGICFEYAVHDAVRRDDPLVLERVDEVLTSYCRIDGTRLESILFGAEKTGSQRLIQTAKELLTPDSRLMVGTRGQPARLRRYIEIAAREFRNPKKGTTALPSSISGLWKADLFLGKADADRWVATTVKINPAHLEGAKGLRVGIVPATGGQDAPQRDEDRNLIICPLPYDGAFMEVFYRGFSVVQQVLRADAKMPREVALPNSADRQVARLLVERRNFPVLDVVDVLDPLAQPELLVTDEVDPELVVPELKAGRSQKLETGGILAPIARENT